MFEPIKRAFGDYMSRFYCDLAPTSETLKRYKARGLSKSIVWAPSRMVDLAEEMLGEWVRNDTDEGDSKPPKLPVMIVSMAKDAIPTARDFTRQICNAQWVMFPNDPKKRAFSVRVIAADIRTQVVVFAHVADTARALAHQFLLYIDNVKNRRFKAEYSFAGQTLLYPVQVETADTPAMSIQTEAKNLTILAIDVTLKAHIPLFDAPKEGEPNDGKGDGSPDDPSGYPVVEETHNIQKESPCSKFKPLSAVSKENR